MEFTQSMFQSTGIGNNGTGRQHRKAPDADIHPDRSPSMVADRNMPLDLNGKGGEPTYGQVAPLWHRW
jgi:hypothetical protein